MFRLMHRTILFASAAICFACVAKAATLIPIVPYPGSTTTQTYGINDNFIITGGYFTSDGNEHGFFGTLEGEYTSFDYPDAGTVEGRGINNANEIVGYLSQPDTLRGFERLSSGVIKIIKQGQIELDNGFAQGIDSKGTFVANGHIDGTSTSCFGRKGKCRKDLLIFGKYHWLPRGINDRNTVVGWGAPHAFVLKNDITTQIDYPGAYQTYLYGVNNKGLATGGWLEPNFITFHAIVYDIESGTFQPIEPPGLHNVGVIGINNKSAIVLKSDEGFFVYCMKKKTCPQKGLEIPNAKPVKASAIARH